MQEEIDNVNRTVSIKEIEPATTNFIKQKAPGLDELTDEFYQTFKGEIIPLF